MPDHPSEPPPNDRAEALLAAAVQVLEQRGEPGLQAFLTANATHADAVRSGLERLRHLGLLSAPASPPVERQQYGEFRIVRRLAAGGMGVVYLAEQTSLHRQVALKVVRPELLLSASVRERFQREVEAVARLQHPGIVPILAVGTEDNVPWFAMEYVAGHTLEDLVHGMAGQHPARATGRALRSRFGDRPTEDSGPTAVFAGSYWEACVRLVLQVANTMSYVHERGIVHRDLKPSNVVVTARGEALLFDFGLAHVQDLHRLTRVDTRVGSPAYMAPEQVRGEAVDERVDVYGLGVTLYQLLTTKLPFVGGTNEQLQQHVLTGAPRSVRAHNRAVPRDLEIACAVAMDRDRARRYGSMAEFAQDLAAVLARRPIRARPLAFPLRAVRFWRRHPVWSIAAACAAVVLLQFPLVLWRVQAEANRELAATNAALDRQRAEAQANFDDALTTIQELMLRTSQVELAAAPGGEELRAALLGRATAMYDRLAARRPHDALLVSDSARALQYLGNLECSLGSVHDGERHLRESLQRLESAAAAADLVTRGVSRKLLGQSLSNRGELAAAESVLRAGICDLETAWAVDPDDWSRRRHLAELKNSLSIVRRQRGDRAEELQLLLDAQADKEAMVRAAPHELGAAVSLALGCLNLSGSLADHRRADAAREVVDRGIAVLEALRPEGPESVAFRGNLASLFEQSGWFHQDASEFAAAADDHGRALALRLELHQEFPHATQHAGRVANSCHNLARSVAGLRQHELALQLEDESVTRLRAVVAAAPHLSQPKQNLEYALAGLCTELLEQRQLDRLTGAVDELAARAQTTEGLLNAARVRIRHGQLLREANGASVDAEVSHLRELAVAHVAAAVARGFGDVSHFERGRFARYYRELAGIPAYDALLAQLRERRRPVSK